MKSIVHGSFTIERSFRSSPARVFDAFSDSEMKARWFNGPRDRWTLLQREVDLRVGGTEILHGEFTGGKKTLYIARYHVVEPERRLVWAYDMHLDEVHFSVSLATLELMPKRGGGTRMTFVEQAAFFDGEDGTKSREHGTSAHFDALAGVLEDPREIVSARLLDAPRGRVFEAFRDPVVLAKWWGPKGFTNTFHAFRPEPNTTWRFTMHAPDGSTFEQEKKLLEVTEERIVLRHVDPSHAFTMTMKLIEHGAQTYVVWRLRFEDEAEADRVRAVILVANEENFDRLTEALQR